MQHLTFSFELISSVNLKVQINMSSFASKGVKLLGYIVNFEGINLGPRKTSLILNSPLLTTETALGSFIGLASYYDLFIK